MPLIMTGFPDYEYRPYPKFLTLADGSNAVAEHAQHEAELMGGKPVAKATNPAQTEDEKAAAEAAAAEKKFEENAEREFLMQQCKSRNIKIHPKAGLAKLRAALA